MKGFSFFYDYEGGFGTISAKIITEMRGADFIFSNY